MSLCGCKPDLNKPVPVASDGPQVKMIIDNETANVEAEGNPMIILIFLEFFAAA